MNKYYEYFLNSKGNRDLVFSDTLSHLQGAPLDCLEIGCARNLDFSSRASDGWSSFHYYTYILKHGGHLTICDIDQGALDNCKELFSGHDGILVSFLCADGKDCIDKDYNLIYLDGGDDPSDMVTQMNSINLSKQLVLCDDFHTKGSSVRVQYPKFISYRWQNNPHEMALYKHQYAGIINLDTIQ